MTVRLIRGDCLRYMKLIPDNSVDLVMIDPPYDIGKANSGWCGERKFQKDISNMITGIDIKILFELKRIMKRINIYIWCSKRQFIPILKHFYGCNWDIIKWNKTNPIPACYNRYLSDTEYCLFIREKGVNLLGNYHTKKTFYVSPINLKDKRKWGHPTIKPLNITKNLMINSSKPKETVLDCFMGSGTTGVACKQLHRNFIGIEKDTHYFNVANLRINKTKPFKAERLS